MSSWSAGYVTYTGYTYGYYEDMNPMKVQFILRYLGYKVDTFERCFELGVGQGISINIHSLTSDIEWYGNDFNPDQIAFAKQLAKITGATISDQSFEELLADCSLPSFDFICLHGIWSWISDENRANIVKFCQRHLRVGGVLYISYNTCPGHNPMVPIRNLMTEYTDKVLPKNVNNDKKIESALAFIEGMQSNEAKYFEVNPILKDRLKALADKPKNYLAHEYFNRDWVPMDITETATFLNEAKLSYVTSTDYIHQIRYVNFTKEQIEFMDGLGDEMFAQKVGDYLTNSQFRKDLWIKGSNRVSQYHRLENLKEQAFVVVENLDDFTFDLTGQKLTANLQKEIYEPIIELLGKKKVLTNQEIFHGLKEEVSLLSVCEATMILCAKKVLAPSRDLQAAEKYYEKCKAYNLYISELSKYQNGFTTLASPVTGGGVVVSKFSQVFVNYILSDNKKYDADILANYACKVLTESNQKIQSKGKVLEKEEDSVEYLRDAAKVFIDKELKRLKTLMIVKA